MRCCRFHSACKPNLHYNYSEDRKSIVSVTITTEGNICSVKVPVSVPSPFTSGAESLDQVGTEPAIYWTEMSGKPVAYILKTQVTV